MLNLFISFENNSLTLDHPGDDYSAGGTVLTAVGAPTMPTTQPFAGLRSGYLPNASQYWYMPSASIFDIADGSFAFSFYHDAVWPTSEAFNFLEVANAQNHLLGRFTGADGSGGFEVNIRTSASGQLTISTGDLGLGTSAYYSGKVEWDEAATTIRIKIYDATGTQIGSTTVNTSVPAGYWPSTIDRLNFGDMSGVNGDWYIDNILLGDIDSEPLEDNFDIETYGDYGTGTITTVDSTVVDAEQDFDFTTSGFGSEINSVIFKVGAHETDLTASLTGSSGVYTADANDVAAIIVDTLGSPFSSASHTTELEVSDGTDTHAIAQTRNPKATYKLTEVASARKTAGSLFEEWIGTPADTDQVYYESDNNTVNTADDYFEILPDGTILTNILTGTVHFVFFDTTDSYWKPGEITISLGTVSARLTGAFSLSLGLKL